MNAKQIIPLIDFHNHYVGPRWTLNRPRAGSPETLVHWDRIEKHIKSVPSLLEDVHSGVLAGRVLSTPPSLIWPEGTDIPADGIRRVNDELAEIAQAHPQTLPGFVSVDAFAGEPAAREVERGVKELGLRGLFVESAQGDKLLDAPEARPALAVAAQLGIPVFVHPLNPEALTRQLKPYKRLGIRLARGTVNAAALVALLEGGVFEEHPGLHIVITTLAIGGLLLAGGFGDGQRLRADTAQAIRRHVYIDTMGFHPALIRASIDLVGADHVLAGSDWPIAGGGAIRPLLEAAFTQNELTEEQRHLIYHANTRRLLKLS